MRSYKIPKEFQSGDLLTRKEAAGALRISLPTICRLLASGQLPYVKFDKAVRIRRRDIEAFLDARTTVRTVPATTDETHEQVA